MPCHAVLTDMNQPLARAAGNGLEVLDAVHFLREPSATPRQAEVVFALTGEMLLTSGLAATRDEGIAKSRALTESGAALERFGKMIAALGGPADFIDAPEKHLAGAKVIRDIPSPGAGIVTGIATRDIGLAVVELGGGRKRAADRVDPTVGFTDLIAIGESVSQGAPLGRVHAADEASAEAAIKAVQAAYRLGDRADTPGPILEIIAG